jgi:hypothetical protein
VALRNFRSAWHPVFCKTALHEAAKGNVGENGLFARLAYCAGNQQLGILKSRHLTILSFLRSQREMCQPRMISEAR